MRTGRTIGIVGALLVIAWVAVSAIDYADALEAEAIAKEERAIRAAAELSFPIQYDAKVTQSGPAGNLPRTYYYVRSER